MSRRSRRALQRHPDVAVGLRVPYGSHVPVDAIEWAGEAQAAAEPVRAAAEMVAMLREMSGEELAQFFRHTSVEELDVVLGAIGPEEAKRVLQRLYDEIPWTEDEPLDAYCGLASNEMADVLRSPFDGTRVVRLRDPVPGPEPQCPAMKMLMIFGAAANGGRVQMGKRGYLPLAFCREVQGWMGAEFKHPRTRPKVITHETEYFDLALLHVVFQEAGIVSYSRPRQLEVTRAALQCMAESRMGDLYPDVLRAFVEGVRWDSFDVIGPIGQIQSAVGFSMYLLHLFGDDWVASSAYEDRFLDAFPRAVEEVAPMFAARVTSAIEAVRIAYTHRTFETFGRLFGLVELRWIEDGAGAAGGGAGAGAGTLKGHYLVRRGPLFERVFEILLPPDRIKAASQVYYF